MELRVHEQDRYQDRAAHLTEYFARSGIEAPGLPGKGRRGAFSMLKLDTDCSSMAVYDKREAESDRWLRLKELLIASWRRQLLEGTKSNR